MLRGSLKDVLKADPIKIRRKVNQQDKFVHFYQICVSIPVTMGLSLLFFLLFILSARG